MRTSTFLFLLAVPTLAGSCSSLSSATRQGLSEAEQRDSNAREIEALAVELADRAESRSPLGSARIQIGQINAIEPRSSSHQLVFDQRTELCATEATVRHELSMSLSNSVNIVGDGAELATHRIEGEFLPSATSLELSLRLVEIKSDWIVATARRRIDNFVPKHYDRPLQSTEPPSSVAVQGATAAQSEALQPGQTGTLEPAAPMLVEDADWATLLTIGQAAEDAPAEGSPGSSTVVSAETGVDGTTEATNGQGPVLDLGPQIPYESGPAAARLRSIGALPASSGALQDSASKN